MKSILFLVPKMNGPTGNFVLNSCWDSSFNQLIKQRSWNVITPSILVLAAIGRQENYEVEIVDENFRTVNVQTCYDIVCIYTVTPNVKRAYHYAKLFKKNGSYIVLGGVHATLCSSEVRNFCDTVMVGEGELIFRQFLNDYRNNQQLKIYIERKSGVSLDTSPVPLYGSLNKEEQHLLPIQTARGCSHSCKFCNVRNLYGDVFRGKSAAQVNRELLDIASLEHVRNIYLTDDNILSDAEHFETIVNVFKNSRFKWYANVDISFGAKKEVINSAYESGLRQVLIGLESISYNNLYYIDKDNFKYKYINQYKEYIKRIQGCGIAVTGSFIVGQKNDTEDTFKYLEQFIYDTKLYAASITIYTPYPGTRLFNQLNAENKILTYDWDYYTIFEPVIKTGYLSIQQLNRLYRKLVESINSKEFVNNKLKYFSEIYREKA